MAYCAAALILAVLAVAISAANGYLTQPLTHLLSAKLGRQLQVDGGLRIYFGRNTRIRAAGVRLANVPWGARREMLLASELEVDIATVSLLRDTVIVPRLQVRGLDVQLERNAEGLNNWTFNLHGAHRPGVVPLVIESAQLPGAHLRFIGPRLQQPLEVAFDSLEQHALADGMLDLAAAGRANGTSLDLRTHVGPLANLVDGRDFKVQADGQLGEIELGIKGSIDSLARPINTQITLDLKGPDADYLTTHLGLQSLGGGPVALKVTISPASSALGVSAEVLGQIGAFAVTAQGSMLARESYHELNLDAHVSGPDLSRLGFVAGFSGLPIAPFELQLAAQRGQRGLLIKQAELSIANGKLTASGTLPAGGGLAGSELKFGAEIPDIEKVKEPWGLAKVLRGPVSANGQLSHLSSGEVRLRLEGTTNLGKLSLQGALGAAPSFFGTKLAVTLRGSDFAPLARVLKLRDQRSGAYDVGGALELKSSGIQLRNTVLTVASDRLRIDGNLGRRPLAAGADLQIELQGGSAARLASRFGQVGWPAAKYRIAGRIQRVKGSFLLREMTCSVAGASLQLDGALGDSADLVGTSLNFKFNGTAIENFKDLFPTSFFPSGPFAASGQFSVVSQQLQLSKTHLRLADAQATASAELDLPLSRATMRYDIDAKIPDLAKLLPRVGGSAALGKNLTIGATGQRSGEEWSLERLALGTDNGMLNARGGLVLAPAFAARDLKFQLRTASLRKLGLLSGRDWPEVPLELRGSLTQSPDSLLLDELIGRLGGSDFAGRVAANTQGGKPNYDVSLTSQRLDLDPYLKIGKSSAAPAATVRKDSPGDRRLVIPAEPLRLPDLNAFSGKLSLRAQALRMRAQDYRDFQVLASLRNGRLQVDPLAMTSPLGQMNARFEVTATGPAVAAKLSASVKNLRLSMVPLALGDANGGLYAGQADLQGSGGSWRELAASLNGRLRLTGTGGRIPNSHLTGGSNVFIRQLVVSLDPMANRQPNTEIACTAFLLRAKDGVVTTDPALVMRTAEVDIVSNGSADLRSEKLDLNFKVAPRRGLGINVVQVINPYLKVTGSLANPGVTIDPTGALVNGGAAFATAGLSIVATTLWDRVVHEKDPCGAAAAESERRAQH